MNEFIFGSSLIVLEFLLIFTLYWADEDIQYVKNLQWEQWSDILQLLIDVSGKNKLVK